VNYQQLKNEGTIFVQYIFSSNIIPLEYQKKHFGELTLCEEQEAPELRLRIFELLIFQQYF